jgi:cell division protein FtsZ
MNTVRAFAADDATIIYGGVYDDTLGEDLRVTVVATGLGQPLSGRQQKPQLVVSHGSSQKTGTDNQPLPTLTMPGTAPDYGAMSETPAVFRRRDRAAQVEALANSGVEKYDIPAFLRKQAD